MTRLARTGNGIRLPKFLAGFRIVSRYKAPNAELAAGHAHHDLVFGGQRGPSSTPVEIVHTGCKLPTFFALTDFRGL